MKKTYESIYFFRFIFKIMYGKTFGPVRFYWTAKRKNFPIRPRHARDDKCDTVFIFFLNTFREKGPENSKYCNVVPRNVRAAGSLRFSFPSRRAFDFFFFDYLKEKKTKRLLRRVSTDRGRDTRIDSVIEV